MRGRFSADALLEAVQHLYDEVLASRVERVGRRAAEELAALLGD